MKSLLRGLTPPFLWNLLHRATVSRTPTESPVEGSQRSSDFYDAVYSRSEEYRRHYANSPYYCLWCELVGRIRPAEVGCIFDVGCGPGQLAAFLQDRGLQKYVGLDFSHECIRIARSVCPSFEFVCADAFTCELFNTLEYDVVVATEFLEHVEGDLIVLDRIRPLTRVYGSVPNFAHPGHVRYFKSPGEVYTRYESRFTDFRVDEFIHGSRGLSFFLLEGVRRAAA